MNNFKVHARRIWLFTARPDVLNPLSVVNSKERKIQSKTWTCFATSNTFKTSRTRSLNPCHLLCSVQEHTPTEALCWAITSLSYHNVTPTVASWPTNKTIPNTCLRPVKTKNISSVGSRRWACRCTITTCSRKNTPLCVSQGSITGMVARSSRLPCQLIMLSRSGNSTL